MIRSNRESAAAEADAIHEGADAVEAIPDEITELSVTNIPSSANCTAAYDKIMGEAKAARIYVDERSDLAVKIDAVFMDIDTQTADGISGG